MVSSKTIRQAIYQRLNVAGLTALLGSGSASIVHGVAAPTASFPLCVFHKQSGVSRWRFGGNAMDSQLWLIKGVVKGTSANAAEDIATKVSDLLDFSPLVLSGGTNLHLARESDIEFVETEGDQTYRHVGSLYRVVVSD